jgi:hypothetical protein
MSNLGIRRVDPDPHRSIARRRGRGALAAAALAAALALAAASTPSLYAAAPLVGTEFVSITLDGTLLGDDFTPTNFNSYYPTVLFDPTTGVYHLWVHDDSGYSLTSIRHATSTNGIDFVSTGNLSYSGGPPYPAFGAATEPTFQFLRAVRVGSNWKLLLWTPHDDSGSQGQYDYNITVFDLGTDPNNLAAIHQGPIQPVPGGTSVNSNGPFGLIGTTLFAEHDPIGGMARYAFTDGAPPSVVGPSDPKDLITGTGSVNYTIDPMDAAAAYVNNAARTLAQADTSLGTFYALRTYPDGSRVSKQLFYVESTNNGVSWTSPVGLFANGDLVTVDGGLAGANFSHPEVTLANGVTVLYFSTAREDGKFVVVTNLARKRTPEIPTLSGIGLAILMLAVLATAAFHLARSRG